MKKKTSNTKPSPGSVESPGPEGDDRNTSSTASIAPRIDADESLVKVVAEAREERIREETALMHKTATHEPLGLD